MALALSEEHLALTDAVRGWAARALGENSVRDVVASGDRGAALYRTSLRAGLAGQGLLGLHLPEAVGGQGYGLPELAVAVEELGRVLLPGAFLPSVLASAVLGHASPATGPVADGTPASGPVPAATAPAPAPGPAGTAAPDTGRLLRGLADGSVSGAVGLAAGMRVAGTGPGGGDLIIDGTCGPVLGASLADVIVLPVSRGGGAAGPHPPAAGGEAMEWVVVDTAGLRIEPLDALDLTRPADQVSADRLSVPHGRVLTGLDGARVESLAATLLGAEACGIAAWAVATAAGYAKARHQFGRPIGQFQAVKHRCGWMLTAAEQAAAAVWDAARADEDAVSGSGSGTGRDLAAAVAAVVAVDAAVTCAQECIQVLGGIGYTWEHDAHLYYRRALTLRALLGPSGEWAARVARLALGGSRRALRVGLPAGAGAVRTGVRGELARIAAAGQSSRPALLADGGWVIPHLPRPWGRDATPLEQIVIGEEMRAAGLRPPSLAIGAWVVPALARYGTPGQRERFLPATLRGEITWCQLFSEPGAGSDLAGLSTRAVRAEGGWLLSGQKVWTSLAREASWAICIARTDPDARRHEGITYFLLDMSSPGVKVSPLREITGDAFFNEVFLDGVFVPDDLVVGAPGNGWQVARATLANERVSLSQLWTFGCGVPELLEVVNGLDVPVPAAVLERTGRLVCEGQAIDLLGMRVTLKQLSGMEPGATGSVRKLLAMRHAQQIAEECWGLTGPAGAAGSTRWARAMLFTRAFTIGGGTTDIQLNIISERILGLPRDPLPGE